MSGMVKNLDALHLFFFRMPDRFYMFISGNKNLIVGMLFLYKNKCLSVFQTHIEGKKNLHKARDGFKDYDFDNRLSVRINAALHRVETEGTPL